MKLYYSPGACSLSVHISLREAGLDFELERVNLAGRRTEHGADFNEINPKGYVPTLEIAPGTELTEGPVVVQWVADQKPEAKISPPEGSFERYRHAEWLAFISTELHKQFSPLFDNRNTDELKERQRAKISGRFDLIEKTLAKTPFLMGDGYSGADGYLFTMLRWAGPKGIELSRWPSITKFFERMHERPAVKAALAAEGLKA